MLSWSLLGQSQNSLDFVALIEESDESKSDQELKESVIEDFKPHLDRDDGVDLLDETPPDSLVAERHCSISPLKVVSLLPHGKSIGQELPHQCSIFIWTISNVNVNIHIDIWYNWCRDRRMQDTDSKHIHNRQLRQKQQQFRREKGYHCTRLNIAYKSNL